MGLILGIDLCDDYSQISCFRRSSMDAEEIGMSENENSCLIPSAVCRQKNSDNWLIGQEAYASALEGGGTMIDKPVKMLLRQGTATISGIRYTAEDILEVLVSQLIQIAENKYKEDKIEEIVFTLLHKEMAAVEGLQRVTDHLGIPKERVRIINHSEAFLFYVLSQKKEIWANQTCLFDMAENSLNYYEMGIVRGRNPKIAEVDHEELQEGFSLGILETESGRKLGDKILSSCAERLLARKIVSSVFLTGKGFESSDWAPKALQVICSKRRVFMGQSLFSRGAAFLAYDSLQETSAYPYICLSEGRVSSSVSLKVSYDGRERQLILIAAGTSWCEASASVEVILDEVHALDLIVTSAANPVTKHLTVPLDELPSRPAKTTRVEVIISFESDTQMTVRVLDKGFGELFPSTGAMIRKDFTL